MYINLKREMNNKRFKRQELAELLGVNPTDISKRINGQTILKEDEKRLIYEYLAKEKGYEGTKKDLFIIDNTQVNKADKKEKTQISIILEELIYEKREKEKVTLKEIASNIGVDVKTLRNWVIGKYEPRGNDVLISIAKYFDVTINYLTGVDDIEAPYDCDIDSKKKVKGNDHLENGINEIMKFLNYLGYDFSSMNNKQIDDVKNDLHYAIIECMHKYDDFRNNELSKYQVICLNETFEELEELKSMAIHLLKIPSIPSITDSKPDFENKIIDRKDIENKAKALISYADDGQKFIKTILSNIEK